MNPTNISDFLASTIINYLEKDNKEKRKLEQEIEILERDFFMEPVRCAQCRRLGYNEDIYRSTFKTVNYKHYDIMIISCAFCFLRPDICAEYCTDCYNENMYVCKHNNNIGNFHEDCNCSTDHEEQ